MHDLVLQSMSQVICVGKVEAFADLDLFKQVVVFSFFLVAHLGLAPKEQFHHFDVFDLENTVETNVRHFFLGSD